MSLKKLVDIGFSIILILLLSGCNEKENELNIAPSIEKPRLNGLYNSTQNYNGSIYKQIWVFSDNMLYTLERGIPGQYIDESLGITYSYSHFFLQKNKLFICGPSRDNALVSVKECKLRKYDPAYEILKIDTLTHTPYDSEQIVLLRDLYSKSEITLSKTILDTIQREVNLKLNLNFFDFIEKDQK